MEPRTDREKIAELQEEIRRLTRIVSSLRFGLWLLAICLLLGLAFSPLRHRGSATVMINAAGVLVVALCLRRGRQRLRRKLVALPHPERAAVLAPLERDPTDVTRQTVAMLRAQSDKDGLLMPASSPQGRGDEPAAP